MWASKIIIIDSFSIDNTLEIIKQYPNVSVFQHKFDNHTNQWNFGLAKVKTEWVLSLDADYLITDALKEELKIVNPDEETNGYNISFKYCVFGHPLRGTILPPRLALFKKSKAKYIQDGHTQLLKLEGKTQTLTNPIYHDDRKTLSRWIWAQDRYMKLEVEKFQNTPYQELSTGDKIRKLKIIAPFAILFYCLILKKGLLDGWRGWYYAFQRCFAELLLSIRLIEHEYYSKNK